MSEMDFLQNLLLGLVIAIPVGPVMVEIFRRGVKHGFHGAFPTSLGAFSADMTYIIIIALGLSGLIELKEFKVLVWLLGAILLTYIGYSSLREFIEGVEFDSNTNSKKNSFLAGYLVTISSPITAIWWFTIMGTFMDAGRENALLSGATVALGALLWFLTLSILLHWGKRFINKKNMHYLAGIAGVILIGFGLFFAYKGLLLL